ncbi:Nn.00g101410.m01.CDS01 [Neocucurbitaria sp. VM-36]
MPMQFGSSSTTSPPFAPIMYLLLFLIFIAVISALPAASPVRPPAGAVSLVSLEVGLDGDGCKPGEVGVALAGDNSALTIIFDNFKAADGPKAGSTSTRAFCRVNIGMSSPDWAFDISSADFRGYVYVEKGVEASLVSRWKWIDKSGNDMKGKGNIQKKVTGPFEDDFLLHKDGELSDNEASACQKKDERIQISLSATVSAGTSKANGYVQGGSADAGFGEILNLSWRKC